MAGDPAIPADHRDLHVLAGELEQLAAGTLERVQLDQHRCSGTDPQRSGGQRGEVFPGSVGELGGPRGELHLGGGAQRAQDGDRRGEQLGPCDQPARDVRGADSHLARPLPLGKEQDGRIGDDQLLGAVLHADVHRCSQVRQAEHRAPAEAGQ